MTLAELAKGSFLEERLDVRIGPTAITPMSPMDLTVVKSGFVRDGCPARLDPILNRLHDSHGNPMGQLWAERSDGTRPK